MIVLLTTPALLGIKAYFVSLGAMHSTAFIINMLVLNKNVKVASKTVFKCGMCLIFAFGVTAVSKLAGDALSSSADIVVIITVGMISLISFLPFAILSKTVKIDFKKISLKNKTTFL